MARQGEVPADDFYAAVRASARRGPHSHGWASPCPAPLVGWEVARFSSSMVRIPAQIARHEPVIGHARLATSTATHGAAPSAQEGQPLIAHGWLLAHNGHSASPALLSHHRPAPADSHALLDLLVEHGPHWLAAHASLWSDDAPHALICAQATTAAVRVYAVRVASSRRPAHPLYLTRYRTGAWLVSSAAGAALLPDGLTEVA